LLRRHRPVEPRPELGELAIESIVASPSRGVLRLADADLKPLRAIGGSSLANDGRLSRPVHPKIHE
jgi:hypothetical protein